MRILVKVRPKKPLETEDYDPKIIQEIESNIEDITFVRTAEFDPKLCTVYVQYEDPAATEEDDRSDGVDRSAFRNAINLTEWFAYVDMSI